VINIWNEFIKERHSTTAEIVPIIRDLGNGKRCEIGFKLEIKVHCAG